MSGLLPRAAGLVPFPDSWKLHLFYQFIGRLGSHQHHVTIADNADVYPKAVPGKLFTECRVGISFLVKISTVGLRYRRLSIRFVGILGSDRISIRTTEVKQRSIFAGVCPVERSPISSFPCAIPSRGPIGRNRVHLVLRRTGCRFYRLRAKRQ